MNGTEGWVVGSGSEGAVGLEGDGALSTGSAEAILRLLGVRTCEVDVRGAMFGGRRQVSCDGLCRNLSGIGCG